MSLHYIPFQPVYFGELPVHCSPCQSDEGGSCGGTSVGGTYAAPVEYGDTTQFQLQIGECEEMEQVLDNPNFEGAVGDQLVEDPTFENGLEDYLSDSGSWSVGGNGVTLTGNGNLVWAIPGGSFNEMLVKIVIGNIDGTLEVSTNQGVLETFDSAGTKYVSFDWTALSLGITLTFTGTTLTLLLFEVYTDPGVPDWNTTGLVFSSDGVLTIAGGGTGLTGINQAGTLLPNTTYLIEVNVIDLEEPVIIYTDAETVNIQSTGVQQFVLTTGASPFIAILTTTGSISIQYLRAYQWFESTDFTVEIWPVGGTEAIATVSSDNLNVSVAALTVSFVWGNFIVDESVLPAGQYYIKVTDSCGDTLSSQPFDLAEHHDCSFYITACMHNDAFGFDFSSFQPSTRIIAEYSEIEWPNEREEFTDTRDVNTKFWGKVHEIQHIKTEYLPKYLMRFLATLPIYNTVYIGTDIFSIDNDSISPEINQEYPTWGKVELDFKLVNHPLIMTKCDDSGTCSPPPPNCWLWEDGTEIDWEDSEMGCVLYN